MSLDSNQIEAVKFPLGSALVIAGPGSGKTTVLTQRVRYMINELNVPPDEILVITFTRAAAMQMKKRFDEMSNEYFPVTFQTFHSLFFSIIKNASKDEVSLISPKEKLNMLVSVLKDKNISFDAINLNSLLNEFSACSNKFNKDFQSGILEKDVFDSVYTAFEYEKKMSGKIDFDDFSKWALDYLSNENIRKIWRDKYKYCLIDEFQDISFDQYEVVRCLFSENVFAVGDDDQSIYAFRGAKPSVCFEFVKDYDAKILYLNNNYRSNAYIVERSLKLIGHNKERFEKKLVSKSESAGGVYVKKFEGSEEEYENLSLSLKENHEKSNSFSKSNESGKPDFYGCKNKNESNVILIRTNNVSERLISRLLKDKIRVIYKDKPDSLLKNGCAKDILSYLKLSQKDYTYENLIRIANKPNRYISRAFITECKAKELAYDDTFTFKNLYSLAKGKSYLSANIFKLEKSLSKIRCMSSLEAILYIFGVIGYERFLHESGIKYGEVLDKLKVIAYDKENISDFIEFCENVEEYVKDDTFDDKTFDGVTVEIATIHSSKGLEWDNVYIPDVNEGNIPHRGSDSEGIEEERRLLYVGMTRAKKNLWIGCVNNEDEGVKQSIYINETEGE